MSLVTFKRRAEAVKFEGEVFTGLDLRSMKAFGSTFTGCSFVDCQLDLTDWRASKFERCLFQNCTMRMVNFSTSFFEDCLFTDCDLEQASFMGSHFRKGAFLRCRMAYGETLFQDATVKVDLLLEDCNLHGSNLDFREVEPKALNLTRCNLWGAKASFGCAFWAGSFDQRTIRQFLALVARASQDSLIAELAGDQYAVICRAMDGRKGTVDAMIPEPVES
jgi:uncharacterized protein YjbI with pentapeptide repeats